VSFRPLPRFISLILPFCMLVRGQGAHPIISQWQIAHFPPPSSSADHPPSTSPTPPFPPPSALPAPSQRPPSAPYDLSCSGRASFGLWVWMRAHRLGGGAFFGSPDPFHFSFIYFVYFHVY
jgi:hypothetical protein